MRFSVGLGNSNVEEKLADRGVSRRDFLKFCTTVAVAMGMGPAFGPKVAQALTGNKRLPVVYLHAAECTGCSESLLRANYPQKDGFIMIDSLILDIISLEYHETIMAAAGTAAEDALHKAVESPDGFVCIVEGAIPTAMNGMYGYIGGHTMLETFSKIVPKAKAVISYGTCAAYGGIQAASPNPTGAKGINEALGHLGVNAINIPGCPPNPYNLVGTIVYMLTNNFAIPELDAINRPKMHFGSTVHDQCERRVFFDQGKFAPAFQSQEARDGWCLYKLGCKGPATYNNCPKIKFNDVSWPVQAGHPCIGCSQPNFWDTLSPFYQE